ncbi:hypothetical protein PE067_06505 [Paracoccus sp. DMF-8]|uniref:hypothetical protein n=1 Tax=Paracoccus sp. DMF-8 TaxID=3019445 RepID=UPI0023E81458|nr:hypothetical protein [Paracoccus sp. DMF-8]MDF3605827.1 hypothetical protein [Paracoccus sp. DMF-8]
MNARSHFVPPPPKCRRRRPIRKRVDAHEPVDFSLSVEAPRRIVFRMVDQDGKIADSALTRDMAIRMSETILKVGRLIEWFDDGNKPTGKINLRDD